MTWVTEVLDKHRKKYEVVKTTKPSESAEPNLGSRMSHFQWDGSLRSHNAEGRPIADGTRVNGDSVRQIAKAVLYMVDGKPLLVVLPGNMKVMQEKLGKEVRMASQDEVLKHTGCEIGLVPPFTKKVVRTIVDTRIAKSGIVSFNAGEKTKGIIMKGEDLMDVLGKDTVVRDVSEPIVVIGLESHMYLKTGSKLYCQCSAALYEKEPNTNICPICTAQPGSKPMGINIKAIELLIRVGLMLNCKIITENPIYVQRKHYFYPDLPNNYQRTSQPVAIEGNIDGVRIREIHFEEDAGRYELREGLVDYNRSGLPLIEVVTEPDLTSPDHARKFLQKVESIIDYLDALREDQPMKTDANISLMGYERCEVKNINSFKGVQRALTFEIQRHKNMLAKGQKIIRETRHFNEAQLITQSLREKESAEDYRYIPDPDVPPVIISSKWVHELEKTLPESPDRKAERFVREYGITEEEAETIASEKELAECFETVAGKADAKLSARWFRTEIKRQLNYRNLRFSQSRLNAGIITELIQLVSSGTVSERAAKKITEIVIDTGERPSEVAKREGLEKRTEGLEEIIEQVLNEQKNAVEDYHAGEERAVHFLFGKVMEKTKGAADPAKVRKELMRRLTE